MPRCTYCRRVPGETKYHGYCEPCYKRAVDMAIQSLPPWPQQLQVDPAAAGQCQTCDLVFPSNMMFADSRGVWKCAVCRKWEMMNSVEMHPGVQIQHTLGASKKIKCLNCKAKFEVDHYKVDCVGSPVPRISIFCVNCRHLEGRYAYQGIINIAE